MLSKCTLSDRCARNHSQQPAATAFLLSILVSCSLCQDFTKVESEVIVSDGGISGGVSWADYDSDSDLDLFVTNAQNMENFFYQNQGNGEFVRITSGLVANDINRSSGNSWGDCDNDGDLDLFVSNYNQDNFLYSNNGDGTFEKVTSGIVVSDGGLSSGTSWGDFDNDGDLDLFVANWQNQDNYFYINDGNDNNWITIKCSGMQSNAAGIGAKVRVKATIDGDDIWQMREISANTGLRSQNGLNAEFGLGNAATVDSIKVEWTSGVVDILTDIEPNQFITIKETLGLGGLVPWRRPEDQSLFLVGNSPNPFSRETTVQYAAGRPMSIRIAVYDTAGREVANLFNGTVNDGLHHLTRHAKDAPPGVYNCRLETKGIVKTTRLLHLR